MNKTWLAISIVALCHLPVNASPADVAVSSPINAISALSKHKVSPMLAVDYHKGMQLNWPDYLYSEKLDGIRAIWTGSELVTRSGNVIHAPRWFVEPLPKVALEGELWIGRNEFQQLMSVVMDEVPDTEQWKSVRFMLFDLPSNPESFGNRYQQLSALVNEINSPYIQLIKHSVVENERQVMTTLSYLNEQGGEGVVLRDVNNKYQAGRNAGVIKFKIAQDAEAKVIGYTLGKGKHEGRMGALVVALPDNKVFKIGTGFTDVQRENPPPLGSVVTFRYNGYTQSGLPKFARFMRVDLTKQEKSDIQVNLKITKKDR